MSKFQSYEKKVKSKSVLQAYEEENPYGQHIGMGNEQTTIFKYLYNNRYFVKYLANY